MLPRMNIPVMMVLAGGRMSEDIYVRFYKNSEKKWLKYPNSLSTYISSIITCYKNVGKLPS